MMEATCRLVEPAIERFERECEPDRFVDLLECLADLRVATAERRLSLARSGARRGGTRVQMMIEDLEGLEDALGVVATRAAQVHQGLQHERLI